MATSAALSSKDDYEGDYDFDDDFNDGNEENFCDR